jgi:hypothetical protein
VTVKSLQSDLRSVRKELAAVHKQRADEARNFESQARTFTTTAEQYRHHRKAMERKLDEAQNDPWLIREELKSWIFALNKVAIGVVIRTPYVLFIKDTVEVKVHFTQVMRYGLNSIRRMFQPIDSEVDASKIRQSVDGQQIKVTDDGRIVADEN